MVICVMSCVWFLLRCDWNMYTIRYAVALSNQRGVKRGADKQGQEEEDEEEEEEWSDKMSEASLMIL